MALLDQFVLLREAQRGTFTPRIESTVRTTDPRDPRPARGNPTAGTSGRLTSRITDPRDPRTPQTFAERLAGLRASTQSSQRVSGNPTAGTTGRFTSPTPSSRRAGGGGGGRGRGTSPGAQRPTVDDSDLLRNKTLDDLKARELDALDRLLEARFGARRVQLEGERAGLQLGLEQFLALRDRARELDLRQNRRDVVSRGILDSGIFLENVSEIEAGAASDVAAEEARVANLVGAIAAQLAPNGLLAQERAAERAGRVAEIERSFLEARLQGGR